MAQPLPYERDYDFEGFQSGHPQTPLPGDKVNDEFDQVASTIDALRARIALLQDDDLALKRGSVGYDQLSEEIDIGIAAPTLWETATAYIVRNTVFANSNFYRCLVSHTSGTFSTDLAAGKWELVADFTGATTAAEAAQAAAEAAQLAAETAQTAAEAAQAAAVTSAANAATSAGSAATSATSASGFADAALASSIAAAAARDAALVARTGSETARTGAETAETGAETAQALAEDARDAAIAAAASVVSPKSTLALAIADAPAVDPDFYDISFYDTTREPASGAKYSNGAEATHDLKFQNANGVAWFNIAERILTPEMAGAVGDGVVDDTLAIQKMLAAGRLFEFGPKTYKIIDKLTLSSKSHFELHPLTVIAQATADLQCLYAYQKDDVTINGNGGMLLGEGTYVFAGPGNTGRYARGIDLEGCGRVRAENLIIRNFGGSGVAISGGNGGRKFFTDLTIQGTNGYGDPVVSQDNFQNGYFLAHYTAAYGAPADNIIIQGGEVSGTAQGFMSEHNDGSPPQNINVSDVFFHDITGQHAAYNSCGGVTFSGCRARDIELAGIKLQGGDANQDIDGFTVTGFECENLGGNMFEVVTVGGYTGVINNVRMQGKGKNVGRALALGNFVRNSYFDVIAEGCSDAGVSLAGELMNDVEIKALVEGCGEDGILVDTTDSQIKISARIRNPNQNVTGRWGVLVKSTATGNDLEFEDLDVQDSSLVMADGVRIDNGGNLVRFTGSKLRSRGAKGYGIYLPTTSNPVVELPEVIDINGAANGAVLNDLYGWNSIPGLGAKSSRWIPTRQQTEAGVTAQVWAQFLEDEGAYLVETHVVGKLVGSAERAAYVHQGLFYRDGGGIVVKQGASVVNMSVASAGWTGSIALQSNGAELVIVNVVAGAAGTCDWSARTRVLRVN